MKLATAAFAVMLPLMAASPEVDKGKAIGAPGAPVTIEIFSDFECPACKIFHETTLPQLVKDFALTGKAYIVSREFPLNIPAHKYSREAANYATAAARIGKYSEVAAKLFHTQESWGATGKVWETVASVLTAEQQKKVQALVKEPGVLKEVQADVDFGQASGVNQTPTLFVIRGSNRTPLAGGVLSYGILKSFINDQLK